jgi:phosphoribosylformimino-5-aminoimidazole carboxamide ribotide isomerase
MKLYPSIDLRGGHVVRLLLGDYDQETVYGDDPVTQAKAFADAGASWIHVVDLDAARTGDPINRPVVAAIAAAVDVPVQMGGGVRSEADAAALHELGVARVVIGTAALEHPELVAAVAARQPVAVGLDVRGREVAIRGWREGTGRDLFEVLREFESAGVAAVVVTQIAVDGTMQGPDVASYAQLLQATDIPVVASGGVGALADLVTLRDLEIAGRRLDGAIVGRALYEGRFTIDDAIAVTG